MVRAQAVEQRVAVRIFGGDQGEMRVAALGKQGSVSALLKTLGSMSPDERKSRGAAVNELKGRVAAALAARKSLLAKAALDARLARETLDVTLNVRPGPLAEGRIHPISQVIDEVTAIFTDQPLPDDLAAQCRDWGVAVVVATP